MPTIKLLDFGIDFSRKGQMARPRSLAWPVRAFRVTLPEITSTSQGDLNPFEVLLLRLLEIEGPISETKLSEDTCIPEDFVKGVLLRLQDKEYIDSRHNVRKKTSSTKDMTAYKPAMIFQELVEGRILPFIYYNTKPAQKIVEPDFYCWQMSKGNIVPQTVTAEDVREAIKEQKRHDRAYGDRSDLPVANSIRVSGGSEYYYLECPIVMRISDGEFRIGNPFGKGYSIVLERIFLNRISDDEHLENWINNWRESLSREYLNEDGEDPEPYETTSNISLYPQLVSSLKPNRYGMRSIEKIYSSIEWALFYANEKLSSRSAINLLRLTKPSDTSMLIKAAAEEIGLDTPERGYLSVQEQSIASYLDEVPEMPTALAIAILSAKTDKTHPLREAVTNHPDLAIRLYQIKKERDIRSHGKGRGAQEGQSGENELLMRELVSTLVPEITFSEDNERPANTSKIDSYLNSRFIATTNLNQRFGYANFLNKIDPMTRDRMVDAESFWLTFSDGENALTFIGDLCASLQNELARRTVTASIGPSSNQELECQIREKASSLHIEPLPDSLTTVRPTNIRKALQGHDKTTLGALAIAFMLTADDETLARLLQNNKQFFSDVGQITAARGHLNVALPLSKQEIDKYRETAYRAISALMES